MRTRTWKPESREEFAKLYHELGSRVLAERYGVHPNTILYHVQKLCIPRNKGRGKPAWFPSGQTTTPEPTETVSAETTK